ncbi:beta-N-acetylhexosaminidase [Roseivirga pacifica]|uniref:beta-N-acetylhexosaminidase n=1 Tax=Roseivirga pacifica TaxID=1267423 RepID=UPI003BAFA906
MTILKRDIKVALTLLLLVNCFLLKGFQAERYQDVIPVPQQVSVAEGLFEVNEDFNISIQGDPNERLYGASTRFLRRLSGRTGVFLKSGYVTEQNNGANGNFVIEVERPGELVVGEDESYELEVKRDRIFLHATTELGAMHGLETVLQLLAFDGATPVIAAGKVTDEPRFPWRGLMVDVSRHFQPIEVIKRNIDGLAAVKMNVLHLHLTDDQGFRVEVKSYPQLYQKGSDGQYFTQEQLKTIVSYAADRGIRVVPEFDVPGHATSWLTAMPELGSRPGVESYSMERNAGIFDPTLDPTNEKVYEVLEAVFTEMAAIFPDEYFHIGGDENEGKDWDANPEIQAFKEKHGYKDNHELQNHFNKRLLKTLTTLNKKMVGWDEILQEGLPKTAVIQSWRGIEALLSSAEQGYQTFLSNGYYIDLMHSVEDHYYVDPLPADHKLTDEQAANILGGEATMWAELVVPTTVDSRVWPRTAAIAERLWSPQSVGDLKDLYRRLEIISLQLEELGLQHITSRNMILRKLANGQDPEALKVISDLTGPLQGYTRNPGGTMYKSHSPFTLWADACIADAESSTTFRFAMEQFMQNRSEDALASLEASLELWASNHAALAEIVKGAPLAQPAYELSVKLNKAAAVAHEAIAYYKSGTQPTAKWLESAKNTLEMAGEQVGRTELRPVEDIEKLVDRLTVNN